MSSHKPQPRPVNVAVIRAAVAPALLPFGIAEVEVVAKGKPPREDLWVGYRLGPGVTLGGSNRELLETVSARIPAEFDYGSLRVCTADTLPLTGPELEGVRGPRWRVWVVGALAACIALFVVTCMIKGRGELVARADLRAAGTTVAHFESDGTPLALWASLDGSWTGAGQGGQSSRTLRKIVPVHYEIDFVQHGVVVHQLAVDTKVSRPYLKIYCTVAPDCEVMLVEPLPTFKPGVMEMRVQGTPRPDVTRISDMSLNLRRASSF